MTQSVIDDIRGKIKGLYPNYRFEVKHLANANQYAVLVFQDKFLGTFTAAANMPSDEFWRQIKAWMFQIVHKHK